MTPLVVAAILGMSGGWSDMNLTQKQTATVILVDHYGNWHGLSDEKKLEMFDTIACETGNTFETDLKSSIPGERSFGLSQINLPSHLDVSVAEAKDPDFAVEFMAKNFSEGKERMWTCWRLKYQVIK